MAGDSDRSAVALKLEQLLKKGRALKAAKAEPHAAELTRNLTAQLRRVEIELARLSNGGSAMHWSGWPAHFEVARLLGPKPPRGFSRRPKKGRPNRAAWLKAKMEELDYTKHRVAILSGMDRKTVQRILDGYNVRDDFVVKLAEGLQVQPTDIPPD